mgnify:CR=1 FL=1
MIVDSSVDTVNAKISYKRQVPRLMALSNDCKYETRKKRDKALAQTSVEHSQQAYISKASISYRIHHVESHIVVLHILSDCLLADRLPILQLYGQQLHSMVGEPHSHMVQGP